MSDESFQYKETSGVYVRQAQPSGGGQDAVSLTSSEAAIAGLTFSGTVAQAEGEALRDECEKLAADVAALATLVNQLRSDLTSLGVIKGGA